MEGVVYVLLTAECVRAVSVLLSWRGVRVCEGVREARLSSCCDDAGSLSLRLSQINTRVCAAELLEMQLKQAFFPCLWSRCSFLSSCPH